MRNLNRPREILSYLDGGLSGIMLGYGYSGCAKRRDHAESVTMSTESPRMPRNPLDARGSPLLASECHSICQRMCPLMSFRIASALVHASLTVGCAVAGCKGVATADAGLLHAAGAYSAPAVPGVPPGAR